jgi:hypothetical protein
MAAAALIGGSSYFILSWLVQPVETRDLCRIVRSGFARHG